MSRKSKRDGRQKATTAPSVKPKPAVRVCDDELTTLAETMLPRTRAFCVGVLAGQTGAKAAAGAGYSESSARSIAWRLLRREDVRRYLRLAQREAAVSSRVTIAAVVERLWRTVTDTNASTRARDMAMNHLVRIVVAGQRAQPKTGEGDDADDGLGLTNEKVAIIEARLLGVRRK